LEGGAGARAETSDIDGLAHGRGRSPDYQRR